MTETALRKSRGLVANGASLTRAMRTTHAYDD